MAIKLGAIGIHILKNMDGMVYNVKRETDIRVRRGSTHRTLTLRPVRHSFTESF